MKFNKISDKKFIIVSNRLPFVAKRNGQEFLKSAGGLVSGIEDFLSKAKIQNYMWIGWPGGYFGKKFYENISSEAFENYNSIPVFISEKTVDKYYNGFCNKIIWPLFHCFPTYAHYEDEYWESYVNVNKIFCDAILKNYNDGDIVWIHDYHLMLLPSMLRGNVKDIKVGFFLHIPFPPPELFLLCPWQKELLEGLLGANLLGFHTYEYTNNFLRSVTKILRIEHRMGHLFYNSRVLKADTFPLGINFEKFNDPYDSDEISIISSGIKNHLENKKIILSADRLDYTKGILNRLLAFERFLEKRNDWRKKVVFIMVVVPSRTDVEHYQRMKAQIEEKASQINGKYGSFDWVPVLYHYKSLPLKDLLAHYRACDVMLVTSIKDGMNLMAKEFIASRTDKRGVLILSEFTGSGRELGEAIIVNPNSIEILSDAIGNALELSESEQEEKIIVMQERLKRYDVLRWGTEFLENLDLVYELQKNYETKILNNKIKNIITERFKSSKEKIIFLDYDGTLVSIAKRPEFARPDDELIKLLKNLSTIENLKLVVVSGRKKEDLDNWLGTLPLSLVAEHGIWIRESDGDWSALKPVSNKFKDDIRLLMEKYIARLPGSLLEEKEYSVAFHYRNSELELANLRVGELIDELVMLTANINLQVFPGKKVVEVRPSGTNKGTAVMHFLSKKEYDFIFAAGDDQTDEDMFNVLPPDSFMIMVEESKSLARYRVRNYNEVRELLSLFL